MSLLHKESKGNKERRMRIQQIIKQKAKQKCLAKADKSSPTYGLSSVEYCSHHTVWNRQVHSDYGAVRGIQEQSK